MAHRQPGPGRPTSNLISEAQKRSLTALREIIAKKGFAHPRKRLASNLELKPETWEAVRAEIVDNIHARPEELRPETWVALAKSIKNHAKTGI